jgi:hypothetical protein
VLQNGAAWCASLPTGPAAKGVCAIAGIAAAVASAAKRIKFRCIHIGRLLFMNIACPNPAAHFLFWLFWYSQMNHRRTAIIGVFRSGSTTTASSIFAARLFRAAGVPATECSGG